MAKLKDLLINEYSYPFSGDKYLSLDNNGVIRVAAAEDISVTYTGDYLVSKNYLVAYVAAAGGSSGGTGTTTYNSNDCITVDNGLKTLTVNPAWLSGTTDDKSGYNALTGIVNDQISGNSSISATIASVVSAYLSSFSINPATDTTRAGKVLKVNEAGTGFEWGTGGGTGSTISLSNVVAGTGDNNDNVGKLITVDSSGNLIVDTSTTYLAAGDKIAIDDLSASTTDVSAGLTKYLKATNNNGTIDISWGDPSLSLSNVGTSTTSDQGHVVVIGSNGKLSASSETYLKSGDSIDYSQISAVNTTNGLLKFTNGVLGVSDDSYLTTGSDLLVSKLSGKVDVLTQISGSRPGIVKVKQNGDTEIDNSTYLTTSNTLSANIFNAVKAIIKQGTGSVTVTYNNNNTISIGGGGSSDGGLVDYVYVWYNDSDSITSNRDSSDPQMNVNPDWLMGETDDQGGYEALTSVINDQVSANSDISATIASVISSYLSGLDPSSKESGLVLKINDTEDGFEWGLAGLTTVNLSDISAGVGTNNANVGKFITVDSNGYLTVDTDSSELNSITSSYLVGLGSSTDSGKVLTLEITPGQGANPATSSLIWKSSTVSLDNITVTGTAGKLIKVNSTGTGLEIDNTTYSTSDTNSTYSNDKVNDNSLIFTGTGTGGAQVAGTNTTVKINPNWFTFYNDNTTTDSTAHVASGGYKALTGFLASVKNSSLIFGNAWANIGGINVLSGKTLGVDPAWLSGCGGTASSPKAVSGGLQAIMSGISGLLKNASGYNGQCLSAVVSKGYIDETYTVTGFNMYINPAWISGGNIKSTGLSGGLCAVMAGISSSISSTTVNRTPASGVSLLLSTRLSGNSETTNSTITGFTLYVNPAWLSSSSSGGFKAISSSLRSGYGAANLGAGTYVLTLTKTSSTSSVTWTTATGGGGGTPTPTDVSLDIITTNGAEGQFIVVNDSGGLTYFDNPGWKTEDTYYKYIASTYNGQSLVFGTQEPGDDGVEVSVNPAWLTGQSTAGVSGGTYAIMNNTISSAISSNTINRTPASGQSLILSARYSTTNTSIVTGYTLYVNPAWLSGYEGTAATTSGGAKAISCFLKGTSIGSSVVNEVVSDYLKPTSTGSGAITGTISSYLSTTADGSGVITGVVSSYLKESSAGSAAITGTISTYLKNTTTNGGRNIVTGIVQKYLSASAARCGAYTGGGTQGTTINCLYTTGDYLTGTYSQQITQTTTPYTINIPITDFPKGKGMIVVLTTRGFASTAQATINFGNGPICYLDVNCTYYLGFVRNGNNNASNGVDFIGYKKVVAGGSS